jgi:archaellum component FlaC
LTPLVTEEKFQSKISKLATKESLEIVANEVAQHREDIDIIKKDIQTIKSDMLEMKGDMLGMKVEMTGMKVDIKEIRQDIKSIDTKIDRIISVIDGLVNDVTNDRTEKAAFSYSVTRHDKKFDDHEKRIRTFRNRVYVIIDKKMVPVHQGNVRRTLESGKLHRLIRCFVKVNFILFQKCVARFCTIRVNYYVFFKTHPFKGSKPLKG